LQHGIIIPDDKGQDDLFSHQTTATFTLPELPEPEAIPAELAKKVEIVPESSSITLKGTFT
jgi:hypothetical protein